MVALTIKSQTTKLISIFWSKWKQIRNGNLTSAIRCWATAGPVDLLNEIQQLCRFTNEKPPPYVRLALLGLRLSWWIVSLSALLLLEQPAFSGSLSSISGKNSEPSDSACSLEAEEALKQASKFLAAKVCATAFSELYSDLQGLTNFSRVFPSISVCSSDHFAGRLKLFLEPAPLPCFSADFLPLKDASFFNFALLTFFFLLPDAMLNTIHYAGAVCNASTGTTSHLATQWQNKTQAGYREVILHFFMFLRAFYTVVFQNGGQEVRSDCIIEEKVILRRKLTV